MARHIKQHDAATMSRHGGGIEILFLQKILQFLQFERTMVNGVVVTVEAAIVQQYPDPWRRPIL